MTKKERGLSESKTEKFKQFQGMVAQSKAFSKTENDKLKAFPSLCKQYSVAPCACRD